MPPYLIIIYKLPKKRKLKMNFFGLFHFFCIKTLQYTVQKTSHKFKNITDYDE